MFRNTAIWEIIAYLMAWNTHGGDVTLAGHCSRGFLVPQADVDRFEARVGNRADHIMNLFPLKEKRLNMNKVMNSSDLFFNQAYFPFFLVFCARSVEAIYF